MPGSAEENEPELAKKLFSLLMRRISTDMRCDLELLHQKSMSAVLKFIVDVVERTEIMKNTDFKPVGKDNQKSAIYRYEGNEFMRARNLLRALKAYNQALAFAEQDSAELALAYGNRSAVCHALKDYELCLKNIELALAVGAGDEQFRERLRRREENCHKKLKLGGAAAKIVDPVRVEPALSYAENPYMPNIVAWIRLDQNTREGRHLVAKRNFAVGDVLMIDEPYAKTIYDFGQRYCTCLHCFKSSAMLSLRPCPGCVAAMFCSEDCAGIAYTRYHRFECPLQDLANIHTEDKMIALRIVCTAISDFDDDLNQLDGGCCSVDAFQYDWNNISSQERYATIHSLVTSGKTKEDTQTFAFHVIKFLIVAEVLLEHSPLIQRIANTRRKKNIIRRLFVRHSLTTQKNAMVCTKFGQISISPLISMMNHSCFPNTTRITLSGGRNAIVVVQPINAGDQIYHNYLHINHLFRQNVLRSTYQFWCHCEACDGDYRIFDDEETGDEEDGSFEYADWIALNELDELFKNSQQPPVGKIKSALETMADLLTKYAHLPPGHNICMLNRLYRQGLQNLYSEPLLWQKYDELR